MSPFAWDFFGIGVGVGFLIGFEVHHGLRWLPRRAINHLIKRRADWKTGRKAEIV